MPACARSHNAASARSPAQCGAPAPARRFFCLPARCSLLISNRISTPHELKMQIGLGPTAALVSCRLRLLSSSVCSWHASYAASRFGTPSFRTSLDIARPLLRVSLAHVLSAHHAPMCVLPTVVGKRVPSLR